MTILNLDIAMISNFIYNKNILITGGTGSFGNKLTEILLENCNPKKIIIFSRDEFKQFNMKKKFKNNLDIVTFIIGDVRNRDSIDLALKNVDIVFHAAALKQVDTIENNPFEAIKTNIYGTENLVISSINNNVSHVIGISTDKCVEPVNLYGATKLCLEKLIISGNQLSNGNTKFSVLRYGNVMGSRGSVIPVFLEQSKNNKFTITHSDMTRFTLTLTEAINFVLNCASQMIGGEIFVPKLPSYSILQLVKVINKDAEIEIIGLRPGEKLYETMVSTHESINTLDCTDFYIIKPSNEAESLKILNHYLERCIPKEENIFEYNSRDNGLMDNDKLLTLINSSNINE